MRRRGKDFMGMPPVVDVATTARLFGMTGLPEYHRRLITGPDWHTPVLTVARGRCRPPAVYVATAPLLAVLRTSYGGDAA